MWWFSETSLINGHIQREGQTRLREASCVLRVMVMVVHEKRVLIVSLETARNSPWVQPLTSTLFSLTQHLTFRGKGKQQSSATLSPLKLVGALTVRSKPLLHYPFYCSAFVDSVRGVNSMTLISFVAERCVVTVCVWTPTVCEPFQHNNAMSVTPVDFTLCKTYSRAMRRKANVVTAMKHASHHPQLLLAENCMIVGDSLSNTEMFMPYNKKFLEATCSVNWCSQSKGY